MDNRILRIEVESGRLTPVEAEVCIRLIPEYVTSATELRGRLMGPRCRFAATVEVSYPVRPHSHVSAGSEGLAGRVVIPEASLWDPQSPFLYEGSIELWQDGQLCQRATVSHGLRELSLRPRGLVINGRRLPLRGRFVSALTEVEALELRASEINLLLVPVTSAAESLWELADRIGFLVIGRVDDFGGETWDRVRRLSRCASCLGWLTQGADLGGLSVLQPIGVMLADMPTKPFPNEAAFVIGDARLQALCLPLLVHGTAPSDGTNVIGTVD